jgi:oligosaccharyltransferase subunit ribophorin II
MKGIAKILVVALAVELAFGQAVRTSFSAADSDSIAAALTWAQDKSGLFGSAEETYHAVRAFVLLGKDVPNKAGACKAIANLAKSAGVKEAAFSVGAGHVLGCPVSVSDNAVKAFLGVKGTDAPAVVAAAVQAVVGLKKGNSDFFDRIVSELSDALDEGELAAERAGYTTITFNAIQKAYKDIDSDAVEVCCDSC